MDSLRRPVGTLPPAVYWRRRILVLGVFIAVLALILYACSGSPAKKATGQKPTASTSPSGASSASASIGGSTPGSGGPGGSGTGTAGTQGSQSASPGGPGGSAPGGASGGSSGATNPGGSTTTGTGPQGACQLRLALTAGSPVYANGAQPSFTVAVVNQGTADCTADLGGKSLILTVYSGAQRIWSTADCGDAHSDLRAIAPGDIQQITVTWPRVRSGQGCSGAASQAGLGTYYAQATLATGAGPTSASFSSSQQSFQLKSGS